MQAAGNTWAGYQDSPRLEISSVSSKEAECPMFSDLLKGILISSWGSPISTES